jgi:aminoglycoside phosphotransferase
VTNNGSAAVGWLPVGAQYLVLEGYSGAGIALVEDPRGARFIRKIAKVPCDNPRLRVQVERQIAYGQRIDFVKVPEVLGCGEFEGRFYFDMQVIDGFDAATYLRTTAFDGVAAIGDTLSELVRYSASQGPLTEPSVGLRQGLEAKLDDLRLRLADAGADTRVALDRLERLVAEAPAELTPTLCHGDMTLDNVLVDRRGAVWVLDLTPPPFEHVWFDVAKLLQDLDGGWYLRSGRGMSAGVRSYVLSAVLAAAQPTGFAEHRQLLVALTFARILPYVRSERDREFVLERLASMLAMPELQEVGSACS